MRNAMTLKKSYQPQTYGSVNTLQTQESKYNIGEVVCMISGAR